MKNKLVGLLYEKLVGLNLLITIKDEQREEITIFLPLLSVFC